MLSRNFYNSKKTPLSIFLFTPSLLIFPSIFHGYFNFSSFAFGLFFATFVIFIVIGRFYYVDFSFLVLIFFFAVHLFFSFLFFDLNYKALFSFVPFLFLVYSSYLFSRYLFYSPHFFLAFERSISWVLFLFLFIGVVTIFSGFEFGKFFYNTHKPMFPFKEPSHYALAFSPLYGFFVLRSGAFISLCVFLVAFLIALLAQSFVLLVVATSFYLLSIANKIFFIPVFFAVIFAVFLLVLTNNYFYERVLFDISSDNLTALVYLQGVQDAYNSIVNTYGIGLGFQMLGSQDPSYAHYRILEVRGTVETGAGLNRYDGGFLAAKIIAEFGVFGIFFSCYYLYLMIFSCFVFFKQNDFEIRKMNPLTVFSFVCIISFSFEFFIRGVGYFSPGFFLFMLSFFYLKKARFI